MSPQKGLKPSSTNAAPLEVIAGAAHRREAAEATLKRWIPRAYTEGASIHAISMAAKITRAAVYQRLWAAGVKEKGPAEASGRKPYGRADLDFKPGQRERAYPTEPKQPDVAYVPEPEPEPAPAPTNGNHPFEPAWNDFGEQLMVCKHCNLRKENGPHNG